MEEDNVIQLDDYRHDIEVESPEIYLRPINVKVMGQMSALLRAESEITGKPMDSVLTELISLGLEHKKLERSGWEGPIYRKYSKSVGRLGKLAAHLGLKNPEIFTLSVEKDK